MNQNNEQIVYVVDDDGGVREGIELLLKTIGQACKTFSSATDFLYAYNSNMRGCLVLDVRMKEMSGLVLQDNLNDLRSTLPIIFITGHGDIPMAVEAMRRGAKDFIRKPFREQDLLDSISLALEISANTHQQNVDQQTIMQKINLLSEREREIFNLITDGEMNKVIAHKLGISKRTVEVHRAQIMKKLEVSTLAQLVRFKVLASLNDEKI